MKIDNLTFDILLEWVRYESETGLFYLKKKTHTRDNTRDLNEPLGYTDGRGYVHFSLLGKKYKAHRLAWLYVHKEWPKDLIDHINGVRTDNRIENLREATNSQNQLNRFTVHSKTGYRGVYESKGKAGNVLGYIAQFNKIHLGLFKTKEEARNAYDKYLVSIGGEYARTNKDLQRTVG